MDDISIKRFVNLNRHVFGVYAACERIGYVLSSRGDHETAKVVIYAGSVHDDSKRYGIEFDHLNDNEWPKSFSSPEDESEFKRALAQHVQGNSHHPEYWAGGVHEMPAYCVYEMVADWYARSQEQGSNLWAWVHNVAMKRFGFTKESPVWKVILDGLRILGAAPND